MSARRRLWLIALAIAAVGALAFIPALSGGWLYDDHYLIPENPYIHSLDHWPRWFIKDFWAIGEDYGRLASRIAYWRPLITTTYAIDWQLSGGTPFLFHLMNLLWHAGVGVLAFLVLHRWIGAIWPAALAALLFLVHPTKAESVAWISGRTDVICMIAVLLVCQGAARRQQRKPGGLALEIAGTLIAYGTKEQAIILPAFVAIEVWVHAERPPITRAVFVQAVRGALPQIIIAVGYLGLRKLLLPIQPPVPAGINLSLLDHLQMVLESMGRFLTLAFAPHDLSVQQGLVRLRGGEIGHSTAYVVIGMTALVVIVAAIVVFRRRMPIVSVGLVLFVVTIAPTSNIIATQMETLISERFLYLPLFGFAFAAGGVLARWPRRATWAIAGVAILVFLLLSLRRAADYRSEDAFWARELALHPDSAEARRARARAAIRERRYRAALHDTIELTRWVERSEDLAVATDSAQLLADLTPDLDQASLRLIDDFCRQLLAPDTDDVKFDFPLANLSVRINKRASTFKRDVVDFRPRLIQLRSNIQSRLGDDATAVELALKGLEVCPRCSTAVAFASLAFARAGNYDAAFELLTSSAGHVPEKVLSSMHRLIEQAREEGNKAATATGPAALHPAALQARARELASLELWGRAYAVLAPYKDEIKQAPRMALGFAELAFRAGDPGVAREVLAAGGQSTAQVDQQFAQWSRTMGWVL